MRSWLGTFLFSSVSRQKDNKAGVGGGVCMFSFTYHEGRKKPMTVRSSVGEFMFHLLENVKPRQAMRTSPCLAHNMYKGGCADTPGPFHLYFQ